MQHRGRNIADAFTCETVCKDKFLGVDADVPVGPIFDEYNALVWCWVKFVASKTGKLKPIFSEDVLAGAVGVSQGEGVVGAVLTECEVASVCCRALLG